MNSKRVKAVLYNDILFSLTAKIHIDNSVQNVI